jgi:hypothetical protein
VSIRPAGLGKETREKRDAAAAAKAIHLAYSCPHRPPRSGQASRGSREEQAPLFASEDVVRFRQRWETLQAGFIDQPRDMVEQADDLVSELMNQLTAGFNYKRSNLEAQWEHGDEVSTEELRVALTRYRSFFNRLLSA